MAPLVVANAYAGGCRRKKQRGERWGGRDELRLTRREHVEVGMPVARTLRLQVLFPSAFPVLMASTCVNEDLVWKLVVFVC